jgi:hypothetical protein
LREQYKGRNYLGSWFWRFQSTFLGSIDPGLVVRQNFMVVGTHLVAEKAKRENASITTFLLFSL